MAHKHLRMIKLDVLLLIQNTSKVGEVDTATFSCQLPSCQMRFKPAHFIKTLRECRFTVKASAEDLGKYQSRYALQTAATPPVFASLRG